MVASRALRSRGVAHQDIGQLEGLRIHGTGGRDAELLIAIPAAVLNGGEHTGGFL